MVWDRSDWVAVDGRRVRVRMLGDGGPTIVLESGLGGFSRLWELVVPHLAGAGSVVAYDRPGLGDSEPSISPRTVDEHVRELNAVLAGCAPRGPYILVGHSIGALIVQAFAYERPDDVAGVVLVDPTHEDPRRHNLPPLKLARFLVAVAIAQGAVFAKGRLLPWTRRSLAERVADSVDTATVDPALIREALEIADTETARATVRREQRSRLVNMRRVQALRTTPFPAVPLVVIAAGRVFGEFVGPGRWVGVTESDLRTMFHARAAELADLSPFGRMVVAATSGHLVNVEAPEVVADAVRAVIDDSRRHHLVAFGQYLHGLVAAASAS